MFKDKEYLLYGLAIGIAAFVFLFQDIGDDKQDKKQGIAEYWKNVGNYLNKGIKSYEEK